MWRGGQSPILQEKHPGGLYDASQTAVRGVLELELMLSKIPPFVG